MICNNDNYKTDDDVYELITLLLNTNPKMRSGSDKDLKENPQSYIKQYTVLQSRSSGDTER